MMRLGSRIVGTIEKRQFFCHRGCCTLHIFKEVLRVARILEVIYSNGDFDSIEYS